jgi:predicted DNA-binding transcriptional regulator YafY
MKSERLLAMLLLLQAKGRLRAREIAGSLEVSERTVYRDLDSLSAAGVPVHAERGSGGGIVLADGYRRALTQFGEDEIRALFVSATDTLADIGLGENLTRALEKLAGALPDSQRRAAEHVRGRIRLDPRRWNQPAQPRVHLAALRRASAEDRTVLLHYRDRNRKVTQRSVDPLGLVSKAGVWYLVARYNGEMRVFRAERILGLDIGVERFDRPASFDLDTFWRTWTAEFERNTPVFPVTLRVSPDAIDDVTAYWESETLDAAATRNRRGWKIVRVSFPSLEVALSHVVAWSERVDIIEPAELRTATVSRARQIIKRYGRRRA